jgi:hypothetical protein
MSRRPPTKERATALRRRFLAWSVLPPAAIVSGLLVAVVPGGVIASFAFAVNLAVPITIAALLLSTPVDAIRLKPRNSIVFVLAIAILLAAIGGSWIAWTTLAATGLLVVLLATRRASVWWATLLGWNPLLWNQ